MLTVACVPVTRRPWVQSLSHAEKLVKIYLLLLSIGDCVSLMAPHDHVYGLSSWPGGLPRLGLGTVVQPL